MNPKRMLITAFFSFTVLTGCAATNTMNVQMGQAKGDIIFKQLSTDVNNYLSSHSVVDSTTFPVRLYHPTSDASTNYSKSNTPINALNSFKAANYQIDAAVQSTTNYRLGVDSILFDNGAMYRFGSSNPTSPHAVACQLVPNQVSTCDIKECAVLVTLKFRLTGNSTDIGDLAEPVTCQAEAFIDENLVAKEWQARSDVYTGNKNSLTTGWGNIQLLVRETSEVVNIALTCSAPLNNTTDFVVIPGTNITPLTGSPKTNLTSLTCNSSPVFEFDIPVERNAGKLKGYFDLSGHIETDFILRIDNGFYQATYPLQSPAPGSALVEQTFHGIREGNHSLTVKALTDQGRNFIAYPYKDGLNGNVIVTSGATENLGATFVSKPAQVTGNVILEDYGKTDLNNLVVRNFTSGGNFDSSYMEARGRDKNPAGTSFSCAPISAGTGGRSLSAFQGSYSQGQASLNYNLLLNGLSPVNGNLNGTDLCPALWVIENIHLLIDFPAKGKEELDLELGTQLEFQADLSKSPYTVNHTQKVCFGKETIKYRADPTKGAFYNPYTYIYKINSSSPPTGYSRLSNVSANIRDGEPENFSKRNNEITVSATLPSSFRYRFSSQATYVRTGGIETDATRLFLPSVETPSGTAHVPCGGSGDTCVYMEDPTNPSGQIAVLSASFNEGCFESGFLVGVLSVNSGGQSIQSVSYQVDNGPIVPVCTTNCGIDPQFAIGPNNLKIDISQLSPGKHFVKFKIIATNGCTIEREYPFDIPQLSASFSGNGCFESGDLVGILSVPSGAQSIQSISCQIDNGPIAPICVDCGRDPQFTIGPNDIKIDISTLNPGSHSVKFDITSAKGCNIKPVYSFDIPQPRVLACPPNLNLISYLGERYIPSKDLRVQQKLKATLSGGCPPFPALIDNIPQYFPIGNTTVQFNAGNLSCQTDVNNYHYEGNLLSFIETNQSTGEAELKVHMGAQSIFKIASVSNYSEISEFNPHGYIGLVEPTKVSVYSAVASLTSSMPPHPVPFPWEKFLEIVPVSNETPLKMSFRPLNKNIPVPLLETQILILSANASNEYFLNLYDDKGSSITRVKMPVTPGNKVINPQIAWYSEKRAVIAFNEISGQGPQGIFGVIWDLSAPNTPTNPYRYNLLAPSTEALRRFILENHLDIVFATDKGLYQVAAPHGSYAILQEQIYLADFSLGSAEVTGVPPKYGAAYVTISPTREIKVFEDINHGSLNYAIPLTGNPPPTPIDIAVDYYNNSVAVAYPDIIRILNTNLDIFANNPRSLTFLQMKY